METIAMSKEDVIKLVPEPTDRTESFEMNEDPIQEDDQELDTIVPGAKDDKIVAEDWEGETSREHQNDELDHESSLSSAPVSQSDVEAEAEAETSKSRTGYD